MMAVQVLYTLQAYNQISQNADNGTNLHYVHVCLGFVQRWAPWDTPPAV